MKIENNSTEKLEISNSFKSDINKLLYAEFIKETKFDSFRIKNEKHDTNIRLWSWPSNNS